jgi:hypothetical protein
MPSFWPAVLGILFAATIGSSYVANPKTAGSTLGGSFITIAGTWSPELWTPVVSLQGRGLSSSDWTMSTTSLVLKAPAGPGCDDAASLLDVRSNCDGNGQGQCGPDNDGIVQRLSIRFSYDLPVISSVQPQSADFGADLSMTIFGSNFGENSCLPSRLPSVTVNSFFAVAAYAIN